MFSQNYRDKVRQLILEKSKANEGLYEARLEDDENMRQLEKVANRDRQKVEQGFIPIGELVKDYKEAKKFNDLINFYKNNLDKITSVNEIRLFTKPYMESILYSGDERLKTLATDKLRDMKQTIQNDASIPTRNKNSWIDDIDKALMAYNQTRTGTAPATALPAPATVPPTSAVPATVPKAKPVKPSKSPAKPSAKPPKPTTMPSSEYATAESDSDSFQSVEDVISPNKPSSAPVPQKPKKKPSKPKSVDVLFKNATAKRNWLRKLIPTDSRPQNEKKYIASNLRDKAMSYFDELIVKIREITGSEYKLNELLTSYPEFKSYETFFADAITYDDEPSFVEALAKGIILYDSKFNNSKNIQGLGFGDWLKKKFNNVKSGINKTLDTAYKGFNKLSGSKNIVKSMPQKFRDMLPFAKSAYKKPNERPQLIRGYKLSGINDMYTAVYIKDNTAIIAIRGTDPKHMNDLLEDVKIIGQDLGKMDFKNISKRLRDLKNVVEALKSKGFNEIITVGHSLGGRLSVQIGRWDKNIQSYGFNTGGLDLKGNITDSYRDNIHVITSGKDGISLGSRLNKNSFVLERDDIGALDSHSLSYFEGRGKKKTKSKKPSKPNKWMDHVKQIKEVLGKDVPYKQVLIIASKTYK